MKPGLNHAALHKKIDFRAAIGHSAAMQPEIILFEAIAKRQCVAATYNRMAVRLAPHILYTRHDELFIDAVTLERDGQPPKELKLGSFKLAGLTGLALAPQSFLPASLYDPNAERYAGASLFAVEL